MTRVEQIKLFLQSFLSEFEVNEGKASPLTLISQVNWAIERLGINLNSGDAFDIAGEIFQQYQTEEVSNGR
jgi:hypothetical protein